MLGLHVEPEEDNVSVLHDVILALQTDKALFFGGGHAAAGHEIVKRDDLCPDKAALKIGVYFACSLRSLSAFGDGPGADLRLTGGEVGDCLLYTSKTGN